MTDDTVHDNLENNDRVFLERLRLAAEVILQLGEDPGVLPNPLQSELFLFKERVERILLMPERS